MRTDTVKMPTESTRYGGRSDRTASGYCWNADPDHPLHRGADCRTLFWSPSRDEWRACSCGCHDVDLADPEFVAGLIAEMLPDERRQRFTWNATESSRRKATGTSNEDVRRFVEDALDSGAPERIADLLRAFRDSGRSCSRTRFAETYRIVKAARD